MIKRINTRILNSGYVFEPLNEYQKNAIVNGVRYPAYLLIDSKNKFELYKKGVTVENLKYYDDDYSFNAYSTCDLKLTKAKLESQYSNENANLLSECTKPQFHQKFISTAQLQALKYDISPAFIFNFNSSFQTRAIDYCNKKLQLTKSDVKYKSDNQELLTECRNPEFLLKFTQESFLEALQYDVPPGYLFRYDNIFKTTALKYGVNYKDAYKIDYAKMEFLEYNYDLKKTGKKGYDLDQILSLESSMQLLAIKKGIAYDIAMDFKHRSCIEAYNLLINKCAKSLPNISIDKDKIAKVALLFDTNLKVNALKLGLHIDQAIKVTNHAWMWWYKSNNFIILRRI